MPSLSLEPFITKSSGYLHPQGTTTGPEFGLPLGRRPLFSLPNHFRLNRRPRPRRARRWGHSFPDMSHFDSSDLYHLEEGRENTKFRRPRRGSLSSSTSSQKKRTSSSLGHSIQAHLSLSTRTWDFNAFTLDRLSDGRSLASLCTHLFQFHGLYSSFDLDPLTVWKFFATVEAGYRPGNPYHNGIHATDVTQAMNLFLQEPLIRGSLSPLELMSALIAAATHDLDHPGLNEKFLVGAQSHLADLYYEPEDGSLLENHHWRSALSVMHEVGLSSSLSSKDFAEASHLIRSSILATDIAKQGEYLNRLSAGIDGGAFRSPLSKDSRTLIVQIAIKCADISNPCRTWHISKLWSHRASEEFFRQGDRERQLSLPISPPFDRLSMTVAKIQTGFYRMVASPLFEEWNRLLGSSLSNAMMNNLTSNHARWDLIIQQQQEEDSSPLLTSSSMSTSSSSSSVLPPGGTNSDSSPRRTTTTVSDDDEDDAEEEDEEEEVYPYLPLDSSESAAAGSRRRFSLPLEVPSALRLGNKRRLFGGEASELQSSNHRVTFHLDRRRVLHNDVCPWDESSPQTAGPVKVPKIFEEDKENSAALSSRRGSAPSGLLLNQLVASSRLLRRRRSFSSLRDSSSKGAHHHHHHRRPLKPDRRRGSLPVFSPTDFQQQPLKSSSCCSKNNKISSSSLLALSSGSSKEQRRKLLRRKSGGSETLLSSLDKSFLRRGSLRLGGETLYSLGGGGSGKTTHQIQRHILVSQETLLDELIKFSGGTGVPPRVQILRGLPPALESELLQKFRTNLALTSPSTSSVVNSGASNVSSSTSSRDAIKRSLLFCSSGSSNNKRTPSSSSSSSSSKRRGSLPTELLSFV